METLFVIMVGVIIIGVGMPEITMIMRMIVVGTFIDAVGYIFPGDRIHDRGEHYHDGGGQVIEFMIMAIVII